MACGKPTPAGLSLDAVLGHGLLAGAGQALVLLRALPARCPSCKPSMRPRPDPTADAVLTTSYLVPQLSQRTTIGFPKNKQSTPQCWPLERAAAQSR